MPLRRLILLSPYRMPTHYALMLGEEDTTAWLHVDRALWHPALLAHAESLPEMADPVDHARPTPDTLYAVPATPVPHLPENWDELVRQAGSASFRSGETWPATAANLRNAAGRLGVELPDRDIDSPSYGLGLGYRVVEVLFEAMEHQQQLDVAAFGNELRAGEYQSAAQRLLAAREAVYPVAIHLIDVAFAADPLPRSSPLSLVATAAELEGLPAEARDAIRRRVVEGSLEVCGGVDRERADALLPVESQLWNLRHGMRRTEEWVGARPSVFARAGSAFHPYLPNWLGQVDISKVVYVAFDGAGVPHHTAATIRWPAPDGRSVDALTRMPQPASDPQTGFHLAYYLHQTIMQDTTAMLLLRHDSRPAGRWYDDLLTLSGLAPVVGAWTTVGRFLDEAASGEYTAATSADDYTPEELETAISAGQADPVSKFAKHVRLRRRVDATWTYLALLQSLGTSVDTELARQTESAEDSLESSVGIEPPGLESVEREAAALLAKRLSRSGGRDTGLLVLNPSPFTRRVGLERSNLPGCPAVGGPVKAAQRDGDVTRLVVEVPGLGFAWVPAGNETPARRMTLAGEWFVRNEFFEAEIDPDTGGLRGFQDLKSRVNRLGIHPVWQPGGRLRSEEVAVTADGPALGEVTGRGVIEDSHGGRLATFQMRYRAWLGRPLLEVRVEIMPVSPPSGYAWHAYYGVRMAWRDERAVLSRGTFGHRSVTTHHRPGSPDFIEIGSGRTSTLIVTGGLPFAQRHGTRMLDVILIPEGESATAFDLFIGANRSQPAQAAQGAVSPVAVVPMSQGPPSVGSSGWLAHLDAPNLLLTSLRPAGESSIIARLFEIVGVAGPASIRWARDPSSAHVVSGDGSTLTHATVNGDAARFDVAAHDLVNVKINWDQSTPQ